MHRAHSAEFERYIWQAITLFIGTGLMRNGQKGTTTDTGKYPCQKRKDYEDVTPSDGSAGSLCTAARGL